LGRLGIGKIAERGGILLSLPQMWKRRSLVIPFLASASFSMPLGSWRVTVFKVECAVAGKERSKQG
jgi:hypothetical protein